MANARSRHHGVKDPVSKFLASDAADGVVFVASDRDADNERPIPGAVRS